MIRRLIMLLLIVGCGETLERTSIYYPLEQEDCAGVPVVLQQRMKTLIKSTQEKRIPCRFRGNDYTN